MPDSESITKEREIFALSLQKKGKHIVKLYPSDAVFRKWKCVCINKRHLRQKNSLGLKTV